MADPESQDYWTLDSPAKPMYKKYGKFQIHTLNQANSTKIPSFP